MRWTADGYDLVTCSPDQTLRLWDATSGAQIKTMKGHSSFVNACDVSRGKGEPLVVSGSDDRTWKLWDARVKRAVASVSEEFPITAVALGDDARAVYTGGIGETVRQWDTRALPESGSFETQSRQPLLVLRGHTDLITDVRVSPDGARVLSNSADNSMRIWDARPYCDGDRCAGVFTGHAHAFEKRLLRCAWSPDATRVASGSSCRNVFVWDAETGKIEYKLPGHLGAVHDVGFHPTEPIIASAGADRRVFLGELAE
jgi:Prp8 binding protein